MAIRTLAIRDALVTELLKIGVTPASGWESGAGAPSVSAGRPKKDALDPAVERQLFVQYGGNHPIREGATSGSHLFEATYAVFLVAPDPVNGEVMLHKLERDARRAIQLGESALQAAGLANAGIFDADFVMRDDMVEAGIFAGVLTVSASYISTHDDP